MTFIWDLDGTLLDSYEVTVTSLYYTYKEFNIELDKNDILKEVITYSVSTFIAKMHEKYGISYDQIKDRLSEISGRERANIKLIKHAKEILEYLREQGIKSFVFTHRGNSTIEVLTRLGLVDCFEEIITGKDGFPRKPDPAAINYFVKKYDLKRENTFYVGDRTIDIECAENAHVKSIMFLPEVSVAKATGLETYIVKDLLDIKDIYRTEKLINEFVVKSREIIKDNLTGIYLHGSAVMGCFNPKKSDIDLIVVVNEKMDTGSKKAFMNMIVELNSQGPAKGIEVSIVTRDACKPFVYPTPFELHFSVMHLGWYKDNPDDYIQNMIGTDKDLAAHFTIIGKRGKCLYGQPVEEVFAEVPRQDYIDSIWEDIADACDDIADNTMYLTLNLARVLAYCRDELILSKKEGGEWGLLNLPDRYRAHIEMAMKEYAEDIVADYDIELAKEYAKFMIEQISDYK